MSLYRASASALESCRTAVERMMGGINKRFFYNTQNGIEEHPASIAEVYVPPISRICAN